MEPNSPLPSSTPPVRPNAGMSADAATILQPLVDSAGWLKFFSIMTMLSGVLTILSTYCTGIIIAWLPVWAGVLFWQAANLTTMGHTAGDVNASVLGMDKLRLAFKILGVYAICWVALVAVFVILLFGFGVFAGIMSQAAGGGAAAGP